MSTGKVNLIGAGAAVALLGAGIPPRRQPREPHILIARIDPWAKGFSFMHMPLREDAIPLMLGKKLLPKITYIDDACDPIVIAIGDVTPQLTIFEREIEPVWSIRGRPGLEVPAFHGFGIIAGYLPRTKKACSFVKPPAWLQARLSWGDDAGQAQVEAQPGQK